MEKIDDLISENYEVSTIPDFRQFFLSTPFYNLIQTSKESDCFEPLKNNFSIACAVDCFYLKNYVKNLPENATMIEDVYLQGFYTSIFPVDYPILPLIRKIYYKLFESGIVSELNELGSRHKNKKIIDLNFSETSVDELKYIFYFSIFGCLFSIIVFLIEIVSFNIVQYLEIY